MFVGKSKPSKSNFNMIRIPTCCRKHTTYFLLLSLPFRDLLSHTLSPLVSSFSFSLINSLDCLHTIPLKPISNRFGFLMLGVCVSVLAFAMLPFFPLLLTFVPSKICSLVYSGALLSCLLCSLVQLN